jgi:hypothetical protein
LLIFQFYLNSPISTRIVHDQWYAKSKLKNHVYSAHKFVSKAHWQTFPTKIIVGGIIFIKICDQLLMNPKALIQFYNIYEPKGVRLAALVPHHKSEAHSLGTPLSPKRDGKRIRRGLKSNWRAENKMNPVRSHLWSKM